MILILGSKDVQESSVSREETGSFPKLCYVSPQMWGLSPGPSSGVGGTHRTPLALQLWSPHGASTAANETTCSHMFSNSPHHYTKTHLSCWLTTLQAHSAVGRSHGQTPQPDGFSETTQNVLKAPGLSQHNFVISFYKVTKLGKEHFSSHNADGCPPLPRSGQRGLKGSTPRERQPGSPSPYGRGVLGEGRAGSSDQETPLTEPQAAPLHDG